MSDYINTIDEEEEKYTIDSNDKILQRLEEYKIEVEERIKREIQSKVEDFLNNLEYDEEGKAVIPVDEEGNFLIPRDDEGNPLVNIDEEGNLIQEPEYSDDQYSDDYENVSEEGTPEAPALSAEEIIEAANRQAEYILSDANDQAKAMMEHFKQDGIKEGYQVGLQQAINEYQEKQMALEAERQSFLLELQSERDAMESELCEIICDVVERAFKVKFSDSKDLIIQLVDNAIMGASASKTFMIRVSEKNHQLLVDSKERLLSRLGSEVVLDIIMDPLMDEDGCMIETDGGIINCGLDVQLKQLLGHLKLLSGQ